ncbi:MAG: protein phosphatase 2C domain-containing protein [Polyangiales bacterium]
MSNAVTVEVCGETDVGRMRKHNEDAFLIADLTSGERCDSCATKACWSAAPRGVLIAVSDGMGGAKAGEVASAMSLEALFSGMIKGPEDGVDDARRLRRIVVQGSAAVFAAAKRPDRRGMGATLTAVFVHDRTAYLAHIGDSRAYLLRDGVLGQVTHDQSYVQMLVDEGVLTEEEAELSPHKNIILQVMGQKEPVTVAMGRISMRPGDRLVLCSDGLSNMVSADELRALAAPPTPIDEACKTLVTAANLAGGADNITVIITEAR